MISTLKKLQARKAAQGDSGGFTLIELLIVIVVLGILAAVVVFSLGSVTSKSAVSACQADGATVNTAMAAYTANNGAGTFTQADLLATTNGGPYLQSFPNNTAHYLFELGPKAIGTPRKTYTELWVALPSTPATAAGATPSGGWVQWHGASTCTLTAVTTATPTSPLQPATVK